MTTPSQHVLAFMLCFMRPASNAATRYLMPLIDLCTVNLTSPHTIMTASDDHDHDATALCQISLTVYKMSVIPQAVFSPSCVSHLISSRPFNFSRSTINNLVICVTTFLQCSSTRIAKDFICSHRSSASSFDCVFCGQALFFNFIRLHTAPSQLESSFIHHQF